MCCSNVAQNSGPLWELAEAIAARKLAVGRWDDLLGVSKLWKLGLTGLSQVVCQPSGIKYTSIIWCIFIYTIIYTYVQTWYVYISYILWIYAFVQGICTGTLPFRLPEIASQLPPEPSHPWKERKLQVAKPGDCQKNVPRPELIGVLWIIYG